MGYQCRNDAKTVSIIALGCFHPVVKVKSASLHFFLGSDEEKEDSDDAGFVDQPVSMSIDFVGASI